MNENFQSNLTDGQKTKIFLSNQTSEDSESAAAAQLVHLCQSSATTFLFHPHVLSP